MKHPNYSTVEGIKSRCLIDRATGCWNWTGGCKSKSRFNKHPVIRAFDDRVGEKRAMSGERAMFIAAYGRHPNRIAYRACLNPMCLNWNHIREARNHREVISAMKSLGKLKGTNIEQRRAAAYKGLEAQGVKITSPEVVLAIRQLPESITHTAAGSMFGVSRHVVSSIRKGTTYRHVTHS